MDLSGWWIDTVRHRMPLKELILDMDSRNGCPKPRTAPSQAWLASCRTLRVHSRRPTNSSAARCPLRVRDSTFRDARFLDKSLQAVHQYCALPAPPIFTAGSNRMIAMPVRGCLFTLLLFATSSSFGIEKHWTLRGRVVDQGGRPVAGASVTTVWAPMESLSNNCTSSKTTTSFILRPKRTKAAWNRGA